MRENKFIIWGAGRDGKKIKVLLTLLGKEVICICDSNNLDDEVISIDEMIKKYSGEIILIGSRKYRDEIIKSIASYSSMQYFKIY